MHEASCEFSIPPEPVYPISVVKIYFNQTYGLKFKNVWNMQSTDEKKRKSILMRVENALSDDFQKHAFISEQIIKKL